MIYFLRGQDSSFVLQISTLDNRNTRGTAGCQLLLFRNVKYLAIFPGTRRPVKNVTCVSVINRYVMLSTKSMARAFADECRPVGKILSNAESLSTMPSHFRQSFGKNSANILLNEL